MSETKTILARLDVLDNWDDGMVDLYLGVVDGNGDKRIVPLDTERIVDEDEILRDGVKKGLMIAAAFCEHFKEDGRESNEPEDCARELWEFADDETIIEELIAEWENNNTEVTT